MKLSTAIRKGAKIAKDLGLKQGRGVIYDGSKVCVLGNALLGAVGKKIFDIVPNLSAKNVGSIEKYKEERSLECLAVRKFPELETYNFCLNQKLQPRYPTAASVLANIITFNDSECLSPEAIADVLEECEL